MAKDDDNKKAPSKLGRRLIAPIAGAASGLAGAALLGSQPDMPVASSAKFGARVGYNTVMQDKEALDAAGKEFEADVKRAKSVKRQRDTGENTNPAGDTYKKGGMTASKRADGIAQRGKTRGKMV
jgi:hypothetical protein